jgi:aconitase B
MKFAEKIDPMADDIYRYLNFDEVDDYQEAASRAAGKLAEIPVKVA